MYILQALLFKPVLEENRGDDGIHLKYLSLFIQSHLFCCFLQINIDAG